MSLTLRGAQSLLRNVARIQVRCYAAEAAAPKEGEMALTFAAGNKVHLYI